jgi:hypothetical protein
VIDVVGARQLQARNVDQQRRVPGGDRGSRLENGVELLELSEPDRGADVVDAVVEAEPRVLEPAAGVGAALVAQAPQKAPLALGVGRDHSALAGGDLLVRIERERSRQAL